MKKLLLIIITFLFVNNLLHTQERENYSVHGVDGILNPISNPSSTYWFGNTYNFTIGDDQDWFDFVISWFKMENGEFKYVYYNVYDRFQDEGDNFQVSSCVYNKNLYALVSVYDGSTTHLKQYIRKVGDDWVKQSNIPVNENITSQFSTITYNDTIYMFFVDNNDKHVKYHKLVNNEDESSLVIVTTQPVLVSNDYTAISSVSAITYIDDNLDENIMIVFSGEASKSNNKINIYTGNPNNGFVLYDRLDCVQGYHATNVGMAQGSVKGGGTETYNIQLGYTRYNDDGETYHCELDMKNKVFTNWETLDKGSIFMLGKFCWFMECYNEVSSHHKQKYLLQVCGTGANSGRGFMWESDQLIYQDSQDTIPPFDMGKDVADVVLVTEGAPPYALNGYTLSNGIFNGNPPSNFVFSTSSTQAVSTETTYGLGVDANMGLGPVTLGFKSTFMKSHGTSTQETVTISQNIEPSTYDSDSAGSMWYFYVAPTIERHRWELFDWQGNTIDSSKRNLFFFEVKNPSMLVEKKPLTDYGDFSPRAYDLNSYVGREVINIDGVEALYNKAVSLDFGGTFPDLSIELDEETTKSSSADYEISVGVEFDVPIIDASGDASVSLEYSRESTTTFSKSQTIEASWYSFRPPSANPDSEFNVRAFDPELYFMRTTDSTAYFLFDDFKKFRPFFITYEVSSIVHGNLNDPPYFVDENNSIAVKYNFCLSPNPAINEFEIRYVLPNSTNAIMLIYNNHGKKVIVKNLPSSSGENSFNIDVSMLSKGLYIYSLSIENDLLQGKLIVK